VSLFSFSHGSSQVSCFWYWIHLPWQVTTNLQESNFLINLKPVTLINNPITWENNFQPARGKLLIESPTTNKSQKKRRSRKGPLKCNAPGRSHLGHLLGQERSNWRFKTYCHAIQIKLTKGKEWRIMGTNITKVIRKRPFLELQGNTSIPSRRIVINMHKTQFSWRGKSYGKPMMEAPDYFINNMTLSKNWQIDTKHQYCSFHIRNGRYLNNEKSNSRVSLSTKF
jgi:hypothetical protein